MVVNMKKLIIIITSVFFLSIVLSSCGSSNENKSSGPITITFSTFLEDSAQADAYKDIIKEFEAENDNVKVNLQSGSSGYNDTIKNSLEKGKGPDIIGLQRSSMLDYIKQGDLKDLTDWVESSGFKDKLYGVSTGYGKYNNKYYGIGDLPYTTEWFYNTDLFKKAKVSEPKNLDDLISICSKLQAFTQTPIAIGAKDPWSIDTFFGMITAQTVDTNKLSNAYLSNNKGSFTNLQGMNDAVSIVSQLTNPWSVYKDSIDMNYSDSIDKFVKGKAAILPMGSWAVDKIDQMKPKSFNYGVFEAPVKLVDNPNSLYSATATQVITVNQKTAHPDEVMKFLDYLFSEGAQKIFAEKNGISSLKSANSESKDNIKKQILSHLEQTDENSTMYIDNIPSKMMDTTGNILMQLIDDKYKVADVWNLIVNQTFAQ